ncbi:MAG: LamB/YcsF family protein [Candidatus Bipolaricaulis sp.]|nr:LamB/YcsF family protein [Candidatus Bipolaricaulis sp.]MDD5646719.1 LamB/YcsF family protein [Candidatus Bipolaricaulis sp.]
MRIDLNCDMGESFGAWRMDIRPAALERISSANIACGFHAGDPMAMEEAVRSCREHGVAVGAHPGFPDLGGFGRREMRLSAGEVRNDLLYQVGALAAFCTSVGVELQHVKPHGALYNAAANDGRLAQGLVDGMLSLRPHPILVALSGSRLARMAEEAGLRVGHEVFADRAYNQDGTLVSRSVPGAVIHDPEVIARRAVRMIREGEVETIDAGVIAVRADSICVHGDTPGATEIVLRLADALAQAKIEVVALRELV